MNLYDLQGVKSLRILPISAIVSVKNVLPSIEKQYGNFQNPRFTIFAKSGLLTPFW